MRATRAWRMASILGALALLGCGGVEDDDDTVQTSSEILNGTAVTRNDSGVVALYVDGSFACSGTYLGGKWVITARHCVEELPEISPRLLPASALRVTALLNPGNTLPAWAPLGTISTVVSVQAYAPDVDVAMLKLGSAFGASHITPPSSISGPRTNLDELVCMGYGANTTSGTNPGWGRLRKAWLFITGIGVHNPYETVSRTDWPYQIRYRRNGSLQIMYEGDSGGPCFMPWTAPGGATGVSLVSVHRSGYPAFSSTSSYGVAVTTNTPWYGWIVANLQTP